MGIQAVLSRIFFPWHHREQDSDHRRQDRQPEADSARGEFTAQKLTVDIRVGGFNLQVQRARLNGRFPEHGAPSFREPAAPAPPGSSTEVPLPEISGNAPPLPSEAFSLQTWLACIEHLYTKLHGLVSRIEAIESRIGASSEARNPLNSAPHPGVLLESRMSQEGYDRDALRNASVSAGNLSAYAEAPAPAPLRHAYVNITA